MTTPSGGSSPDDYWRRPPSDAEGQPAQADEATTRPPGGLSPSGPSGSGTSGGYAGPPPSVPPPAGWRPPLHVQPAPPRQLPTQDMAALDAAEQRAQRVTYGFGAVAGVVLVALVCLLCSRLIF
ncbi:hypothetical protein ACFOOK_25080 [Micromonospora krabiensis]|uniref:hypothetical protein n=1 Tax=Micromonospora krabiensis TaxID=307121 RepID=UPI000B863168|nr:hypothetical protein [Micromonospora krabiensis]